MPHEGLVVRIAVVGSGISGVTAAWLLAPAHEVTLLEAADRLGGHTNTVRLDLADGAIREIRDRDPVLLAPLQRPEHLTRESHEMPVRARNR